MLRLLHQFSLTGFLSFILIWVVTFSASAQYLKIDSLERLLETDLSDSSRVKLLYRISRDLVYVNPVTALKYAKESESLAFKLNSKIDLAYAYRILSSIYSSQEFYSLATEIGLKAYQIFQEEGDSVGLANCNITSGNLYRIQNLHERSAHYHRLSHEYYKKHGPPERIAITALNYGEALALIDSLDKATKLLKMAMRINDSIQNHAAQTFTYKAIGVIYMKRHIKDSAKYYFNKVIDVSNMLGENSQKASTLESMVNLANIYESEGDIGEQEMILEQAKVFSEQYYVSKALLDIYLQLMMVNLKLANSDKALNYSKRFRFLRDSLENRAIGDREAMLSTLYSTVKIRAENEFLADQQTYSLNIINQQRNYLIVISVLASITLITMTVVFISLRKQKKTNELLNQKSQELKELNMTKNKMFSIVSHDLRSPLLSLIGFSELLTKHLNEVSKEEIIVMVNQLRAKVDATLKMTDNLIQWGLLQMEQSTVNPTSFDVNNIVKELYEVFNIQADQKGIKIELNIEKPCFVFADFDQVELIIRNLLNNAIKFTESGGEIVIETKEEESTSIIIIKDNGIGIQNEMLTDLHKLKATTTKGTMGEMGSGLGLMLCYEYALKNNGEISVDSEVGVGSKFSLILPRTI